MRPLAASSRSSGVVDSTAGSATRRRDCRGIVTSHSPTIHCTRCFRVSLSVDSNLKAKGLAILAAKAVNQREEIWLRGQDSNLRMA